MKINDTVPVTIAGQVVANATVRELADGTATLVFPATRVVMAVRTELAVGEEAPIDTTGTETIITGVERNGEPVEQSTPADVPPVNNEAATPPNTQPVDQPALVTDTPPVDPAPVVET